MIEPELYGECLARSQFCCWCNSCRKWKVNDECHELTVLIEDIDTEVGCVTVEPTIYICENCWESSAI